MPDRAIITENWLALIARVGSGDTLEVNCENAKLAKRTQNIFYKVRKLIASRPEFESYREAADSIQCKVFGPTIRFEPDNARFDNAILEKLLAQPTVTNSPVAEFSASAEEGQSAVDIFTNITSDETSTKE